MNTAGVTAGMRLGRRDALWLAVAVSFHAVLLLIPLRQALQVPENSRKLSVSLLTAPGKWEALREVLPTARPMEQPPAGGVPGPAVPEIRAPLQPESPESAPRQSGTEASAAILIDSLNRIDWPSRGEDGRRRLGVFKPQPIPHNWRPSIKVEDNRFDGMAVPAVTGIVDRWLAADGSHRVVVNTPRGETLCGRAQAWNPMQPLIEPVMSWWKCGGGGERAFRMPDPFMRSRRGAQDSGVIR